MVTQDAWELNAARGYKVGLVSTPYQYHLSKELTFGEEELVTLDALDKMEQKGATCTADRASPGFYSQLYAVPKKGWGPQDNYQPKETKSIREVTALQDGKHKIMLRDILKQGDYMTKVDLKDAYFMVPVHQKHRDLTRFMWKGRAYQFTCLPFGLSSAPWAFTKITRPIITVLRCMGLRTIMYIGDILILAESETLAREHTAALIFLLENLGLVVNYPKSQTIPSQVIEFLGFSIESR